MLDCFALAEATRWRSGHTVSSTKTVSATPMTNDMLCLMTPQWCRPGVADGAQEYRELDGLAVIEAGGRLVQQEQPRVAHQCPNDFDGFCAPIGSSVAGRSRACRNPTRSSRRVSSLAARRDFLVSRFAGPQYLRDYRRVNA